MSKASATNIRLLLIDDHALFRESVARLLEAEPGFKVAAHCSSVIEGMRIIQSQEIDIVLLDIDLGQERGIDFLEGLDTQHFKGKVLLVTAGVNESEVPNLIRKGVSGIFLKHGSPALLIQGIRETMEGKAQFEQSLLQRAFECAEAHGASRRRTRLTEREAESFRSSLKAWPTSRLPIG
jgi:two-component system, NarL family, nitrate/nitrite response regulator NarL